MGTVAIALLFGGCQSQQQVVDEMQADATQVAKQRGKFELNCPTATASVLSKEMIQSEIVNPRWAPPQPECLRIFAEQLAYLGWSAGEGSIDQIVERQSRRVGDDGGDVVDVDFAAAAGIERELAQLVARGGAIAAE